MAILFFIHVLLPTVIFIKQSFPIRREGSKEPKHGRVILYTLGIDIEFPYSSDQPHRSIMALSSHIST